MAAPRQRSRIATWLGLALILLDSHSAHTQKAGERGSVSPEWRIWIDHRQNEDVAKLAKQLRAEPSTVFAAGPTEWFYIRDGKATKIPSSPQEYSVYCSSIAVSHDGTRVAYATRLKEAGRCQVFLLDLATANETKLAEINTSATRLFWSWDDHEILYSGQKGINVVEAKTGVQREIGALPLRVEGKIPTEGWQILGVEQFHDRPELLLDTEICVPTKHPGECLGTPQALLFSKQQGRRLDYGAGAAVSPLTDRIAYVAEDGLTTNDPNGSNRRVITRVPAFRGLLKELPSGPLVWSPNSDRIWMHTMIDEGGNLNVYLVDLKHRSRRRILKHTVLRVVAWR